MSLVVSYSKMFHLGIPEREKKHDSNYQQRPLTDPQRFRPVQSCCLVQCVKDYQSSIYIYNISKVYHYSGAFYVYVQFGYFKDFVGCRVTSHFLCVECVLLPAGPRIAKWLLEGRSWGPDANVALILRVFCWVIQTS